MRIYKIISLIILIPFLAGAAYSSTIKGKVFDKSNGKPLRGASVAVLNTSLGAVTDSYGAFAIEDLPAGAYKLKISMIGYEKKIKTIKLDANKTYSIEIYIKEKAFLSKGVIVSANKRLQSAQEVPISASTIEKQELTAKNLTSIDQALSYIPSVKVNSGQVDIRGSSGLAYGLGSRVSFLLDGFPLLSGDQGDIKFDVIPIFNVERIEIVKGAGSALYGSAALGGVINVVTEKPKPEGNFKTRTYIGGYANTKYDEWNYSDEARLIKGIESSYSKKYDKFGFLVSGAYKRDDGYRKFDDNIEGKFFAKGVYDFDHKNKLSVTGIVASSDRADWVYWRNLDSATIPPAGTNLKARIRSQKYSSIVQYKTIFSENDFLDFKVGLYKTNFSNNLEKEHPDKRKSFSNSLNGEVQLNKKILRHTLLTSGLNFVYNAVDANLYGERHQSVYALYSQAETSILERLTVTAGSRADYEKTVDCEENFQLSPKIGASYKTDLGAVFRASAGGGFRTATIAERFASVNFGPFKVESNLNINPEESYSYEAGVNWKFALEKSTFVIDFAAFQNDMFDMIEPTFVESGGSTYIKFKNVSRARIRGVELNIKSYLFDYVGLQSAITLMEPENLKLNKTLKYRSKILWYNKIKIPFSFFDLEFDYRFLSEPEEIDLILNAFIEDASANVNAHVLDARVIFDLTEVTPFPLKITLNSKNLLDYYYVEYPGNLAPTRSVTLQATVSY